MLRDQRELAVLVHAPARLDDPEMDCAETTPRAARQASTESRMLVDVGRRADVLKRSADALAETISRHSAQAFGDASDASLRTQTRELDGPRRRDSLT